jgi:hypothetical protein
LEARTDFINIWFDANIEEWIEMLGDETFATRFMELEPEDAAAIVHAYEQQHLHKVWSEPFSAVFCQE